MYVFVLSYSCSVFTLSSFFLLQLEGLWVSYRTTSMLEMDLYLSILKFSIHDIRPDTKSEMRLMLGSYSETANLCAEDSLTNVGVSNLTMLILDYRWRSSFQSFVIRIQQPRILVVLDFLLPVVEYFVPSLGTITGREESLDPKNDPLMRSDDIILSERVFLQRENVIQLSPGRQLIVDGRDIDEFIYDGCGGTISLCEEFDNKGQLYSGTVIIIGRGKRLRFKNVKIEVMNLQFLSSMIPTKFAMFPATVHRYFDARLTPRLFFVWSIQEWCPS